MSITITTGINSIDSNPTYLNSIANPSTKFYSSKLVNYVEPIEISGYRKTVFYSEVNTNFNVGDRVYILNGNYDSDNKILENKYVKNSDGYRVIGVDGCRIILDIDYTGELPSNCCEESNYLSINNIDTQQKFDYINNISVPLNLNIPGLYSKFYGKIIGTSSFTASLYTNDIVFAATGFNGISGYYTGITSSGFFVRDDSSLPYVWTNITDNFLSDTFTFSNPDYINNNRIYIYGEDFSYNNVSYKQRSVYKFEGGNWVEDIKYMPSYISKLNFRFGTFKGGTHKDGIFGTGFRSNTWRGAGWKSGIFINSIWGSGIMSAKSSLGEKSHYSKLQSVTGSTPIQSVDYSNNRGYGYNFIIDSTIISGDITNANFENCNIGVSSTHSAVNDYYKENQNLNLVVNGSMLSLCDVNSVNLNGSSLLNSVILNSNTTDTKISNSQLIDCTVFKGEYNIDSGIQILASDIWSYDTATGSIADPSLTSIRGIVKLYISTSDLNKVNINDSFYLSKVNKDYIINSLDDQQKIILPIETKYLLDSYFDGEVSSKKIIVSLKNKNDNKWKVVATDSGSFITNNIISNNYNFSSIDIDCDVFGYYVNNSGVIQYLNNYSLGPLNVSNINKLLANNYIQNGDFKSGVIDNSKWINGSNINYNQNIIKRDYTYNDRLDISYTLWGTYSSIVVKTKYSPFNNNFKISGQDVSVGDIVWINSIDYVYGPSAVSLENRYIVDDLSYFTASLPPFIQLVLIPLGDQSSINTISLNPGGYYTTTNADNSNYVSINKFLIDNSTINGGLFKRTGIRRSNFTNSEFNNLDRDLSTSNIDKLRMINILFKDSGNIINNGLVYKSHFVNETFNDGIFYNSIWNSGTFKNGIFKSSYWTGGIFDGGVFMDSGYTASSFNLDYDFLPRYKLWSDGTFNSGEFFNSSWFKGTFNNGRLYKSNWYGGTWNNGILGSDKYSSNDTKFGYYDAYTSSIATYSTFNNGIVDNAIVGGYGIVYWNNGKFNSGEFTSYGTSSNNQSIWYNGDFNGGSVTNLAKWMNGNFNGGKFLSNIGWEAVSPTNSSTQSIDYGWENGKFNGGEFGNANGLTNSTWYNGEFNNGIFQGRSWNNGIFSGGRFIGSGDFSATVNDFSQSFTSSYYGLWNDGWVIDRKNELKTEERIATTLDRKVDEKPIISTAYMSNILWLNGTFSHGDGEIKNSLWLNGTFQKGKFMGSIFNPYVDRTFSGSLTYSFNFSNTCFWENGKFDGGKFYISKWKNGSFLSGEMNGGIWNDGVWYYGNANNVYWESGIWKNGIWNGSPFIADSGTSSSTQSGTSSLISNYVLNPGFEHDILINIAQYSGTNSLHLINAFSTTQSSEFLSDPDVSINGNCYNIGMMNYLTDSFVASPGVGSLWSLVTNYGYVNYGQDMYIPIIPGPAVFGPYYATTFEPANTNIVLKDNLISLSNNLYLVSDEFIYTNAVHTITTDVLQVPFNFTIYPNDVIFYDVTIEFVIEADNPLPGYLPTQNIATVQVSHPSPLGSTSKVIKVNDTSFNMIGGPPGYTKVRYFYPATKDTINFSVCEADIVNNGWDRFICIKRTAGTGTVRVMSATVKARVSQYDIVNNTMYPSMIVGATYSDTISFPNNLSLSLISGGYVVPLTFGNGRFKSGIWENGVWNNGWRFDDYVKPFILTDSLQISEKTWKLTLNQIGLGTSQSVSFSVGDKVSIGNIIAMDINGKRRLIKEHFLVISSDNTSITCQVNISFPVRGILIDTIDNTAYVNNEININSKASNHINYVTKNIWLSGIFLNGYFSGVWNNGLVKGRPYLTFLEDIQWIDGEFDGGHIKGYTSSIFYNTLDLNIISLINTNFNTDYLTNNANPNLFYNKSLIQNFKFKDNNVGGLFKFKHNSWVDVNYSDETQTNIYRDKGKYETSFGVNTIIGVPNLNGHITHDVLSSTSNIRNVYDYNSNNYSLGIKYTKYTDYIEDIGTFENLFSKSIVPLGLTSFYNDGWTIKSYEVGLTNDGFNLENIDNTFNLITSAVSIQPPGTPFLYTTHQNYIILDNSNTMSIPKKRYSMVEYDIISFTGFPGPGKTWSRASVNANDFYPPAINFMVYPGTWSITPIPYNSLSTYVDGVVNNNSIKKEFFYNKRSLLMEFIGGDFSITQGGFHNPPTYLSGPFGVSLKSLNFYEVDMIPFFKYTDVDHVNKDILAPFYVTYVPPIDYTNANYSFVNSVVIQITAEQVAQNVLYIAPSQNVNALNQLGIPNNNNN